MLLLHHALMAPADSGRTGGCFGETDFSHLERGSPWEIGGPEGTCTLSPPADNGALCSLSYGSEMVGSAGNAPAVASGLFEDTGFTVRQPGHFPNPA